LNEPSTETELDDRPTNDRINEQTTMSLNPCREGPKYPSDIKKVGIGMRLKSMLKIFFTNKESVISPKADYKG
jgi:hypothetical protein